MAGTGIKIKLPEKLPTQGLTPVALKAWKGQLTLFLRQSRVFRRFLTGGLYANWTAAEEDQNRIDDLHADDIPGQNHQPGDDRNGRLAERRNQLETFLGIIAGLCDPCQYEDILQRSTSVEWIYRLIEVDHDIQKKGRHFLKLADIKYDKNGSEKPNIFYKRLRSHFLDNLRKTGERVKSRNNAALDEDERMSPTLENTVVYLALKEIDPKLPTHVEQTYGHRLDADTTLFDIQAEVFQ